MKEGARDDTGVARQTRSHRTRDAVVEALLALLDEGVAQPGAREVADRAGVSTRTVFAHFASLEDLYRASVERATVRVVALLTPIDPDRPVADRIDALCAQRARVNEELGPVRRAAARRAHLSPALAEARANGRRASFEQLDRVFGAELGRLDEPMRRRRRAAADAALSGEAWDILRATHGLPVDEAQAAVHEAVRPLLDPDPPPGAGAGGTAAGTSFGEALDAAPADPADAARRAEHAAAERALAAVERRIERLIAAVEAGTPPGLLTSRLRELHDARADAERSLAALA